MRALLHKIMSLRLPPVNVADLLFLILLLRIIGIGSTALLNDPGTSWHLRVGFDVLNEGVPEVDSYSFTRNSEPWISQHWFADLLFAGIFTRWQWNGLVVTSALILAWTYRYLFRTLIDNETNLAWAAGLTMLAAACGASNWLARPHLISSLFVLVTFVACLSYHRRGGKLLYGIPPLMILWCNIHGGFIAGLVILGCSFLAQALNWRHSPESRRRTYGFGLILILSVLATLLNPYGVRLHLHLLDILFTSNVRDLIVEWRAPDLQSPQSIPLKLILLLSVIVLSVSRRRPNAFLLFHFIVWLYFGLNAIRQTGLSALIMVVVIGILSQGLLAGLAKMTVRSRLIARLRLLGRRIRTLTLEEQAQVVPYWSVMGSLVLVLGMVVGFKLPPIGFGTAHLPNERWPVAALTVLNQQPTNGPIFHDLDWGGYLMLSTDPPRQVFIDDRFELYDRDFVLRYQDAMAYGSSWETLEGQYRFNYVLIRPWSELAENLRRASEWNIIFEDDSSILFCRDSERVAQTVVLQQKGQWNEL